MKLIFKRVRRPAVDDCIEVTSLTETVRQYESPRRMPGPYALHTEDGQTLPCQISSTMHSDGDGGPVHVTIVFMLDGTQISVQGDEATE